MDRMRLTSTRKRAHRATFHLAILYGQVVAAVTSVPGRVLGLGR